MGYRILYHHRTQALDGQRVHITAIQQALTRLGHQVVEVSPLPAVEKAGEASVPTIRRRVFERVAALAPKGVYESLELAYNVVGYRALSKTIVRLKPHFIYERYSLNTVAGVWASRRHGVPLLLEVNSPLAEEKRRLGQLMFRRMSERLERYTLERATRVLAVTEVLAEMLRHSARLPNGSVVVVHNGADASGHARDPERRRSVRARLGCADDDVVVGCVGFFREWHGIDLLLRAFAQERGASGARVLLVGEGPAVSGLQQLTAELQLGDHVAFTGAVPHERVADYLDAMDVVVIPRAVEYASPLKLFEYMATGKAIAAPRQRNLLEILTEDRDALFFEPERQDQLRQALGRLIRDSALRARLGREASDTIARRRLTWSGNAQRIVDTYEQIVNAMPDRIES